MPSIDLAWHLVAEGDQVKSIKNGKFYPVTRTATKGAVTTITLQLEKGPRTVTRPTPAEPRATVIRGATGQAIDVFTVVFSR